MSIIYWCWYQEIIIIAPIWALWKRNISQIIFFNLNEPQSLTEWQAEVHFYKQINHLLIELTKIYIFSGEHLERITIRGVNRMQMNDLFQTMLSMRLKSLEALKVVLTPHCLLPPILFPFSFFNLPQRKKNSTNHIMVTLNHWRLDWKFSVMDSLARS